MKKDYRVLLLKLFIGILIVGSIWWLVRCQCVSLKSFSPRGIREYIQSFGKMAAFVYIVAYVLNTITVFPPIATLSLTAGLAFGAWWGAVFLMIGALIGTSATFMISRFFGRGLVERVLRGKFKNLDEHLEKKGFVTVLFFRVIPLVPYEVLNYASGLSRIRFRDYFFATLLGLIPGVIIAAFFGGRLGEIQNLKGIVSAKFLIAVGLMIVLLAIPIIYKIVKKRSE